MGSARERFLLREVYAAHQIFMNVGYDAAEIFIAIGPGIGETVTGEQIGGRLCLNVQLKRDNKTFTLMIATISEPEGKRFEKAWDAFARHGKRQASVAELDAMLYGSATYARLTELLLAMDRKGFELKPLTDFQ